MWSEQQFIYWSTKEKTFWEIQYCLNVLSRPSFLHILLPSIIVCAVSLKKFEDTGQVEYKKTKCKAWWIQMWNIWFKSLSPQTKESCLQPSVKDGLELHLSQSGWASCQNYWNYKCRNVASDFAPIYNSMWKALNQQQRDGFCTILYLCFLESQELDANNHNDSTHMSMC